MKFLILVVTSKTHIHKDVIEIDRADLTRKLDAINTWVGDVLDTGNEVVFFDGGNEFEWFDENNKTLHLTEDDGYETEILSKLYPKVKAALKWAYNNRNFDFLYLCDDDVFINIYQFIKTEMSFDFMGAGCYGGGGFYFTKKAIETILNYENTSFRVCDQAIFDAISRDSSVTKNFDNNKASPFYIPGELYSTIHYVTGKRSYFLHNMLRHFYENGYTNRKIILGGGIDFYKKYDIVSYESTYNRKTSRWYDFTHDPNGWEYHGGYPRSSIHVNQLLCFWPYAENAAKYFVLNVDTMFADHQTIGEKNNVFMSIIEKMKESLIDKNNLFLCTKNNLDISNFKKDNSIKTYLKLNFEEMDYYNYYTIN